VLITAPNGRVHYYLGAIRDGKGGTLVSKPNILGHRVVHDNKLGVPPDPVKLFDGLGPPVGGKIGRNHLGHCLVEFVGQLHAHYFGGVKPGLNLEINIGRGWVGTFGRQRGAYSGLKVGVLGVVIWGGIRIVDGKGQCDVVV